MTYVYAKHTVNNEEIYLILFYYFSFFHSNTDTASTVAELAPDHGTTIILANVIYDVRYLQWLPSID
jgi:hypothetical protein